MTAAGSGSGRGPGAQDAEPGPAAFGRILASLAGLMRKEIALLRAEAAEKARQLWRGVILAVAAALFALVSLLSLAGALMLALTDWAGWPPPVAAAAVTSAFALGALALGRLARNRLDPANLRPRRSLRQFGTGRRATDGDGA